MIPSLSCDTAPDVLASRGNSVSHAVPNTLSGGAAGTSLPVDADASWAELSDGIPESDRPRMSLHCCHWCTLQEKENYCSLKSILHPLGFILSVNNNRHLSCMPFFSLVTLRTQHLRVTNTMCIITVT